MPIGALANKVAQRLKALDAEQLKYFVKLCYATKDRQAWLAVQAQR